MNDKGMRVTMAGVEKRLAQLRFELERGAMSRTPTLDQATEDLTFSLEELHVALEELETTNEELAAAKIAAELDGRRYQELFQLTPAASLVTDPAGVIQESNRAAEDLLVRRANALAGKPLSVFIEPSDQSRFFLFLDRVLVSGGAPVTEEELLIRSGPDRRFTAAVTAVPILDRHGSPAGVRWLIRDLSTQLRAERERREAREREAYRHISGGIINHVNNLLGSIRGYSEIIAREPATGARTQRAASQIRTATERGERLTSPLLAFARVGRNAVHAESVNGLVLQAGGMAREVLPEGTELEIHLSPEAGSARVDGVDLHKAMMNLIINARDALENGGEVVITTGIADLDVTVAERLDLKPGRYVTIAVSDAGRGMDAETRERAFEPFFSTKAIGTGFGLGLSTVEAIVQDAKGAVDLQSDTGTGCVVTLYLPSSLPSV